MPTLDHHQSSDFTKLLLIGDSKSGKTGALASLALAGYKLRILDYDNGLDILAQLVRKHDPSKLANVEFRTLRDQYSMTPLGPLIMGTPKAFTEGSRMIAEWKYDNVNLGKPEEWGPECIFVLDSFTFFSDAAFAFREPLVPKSKDGKYDVRAVYKDAQDAVESILAVLTSEHFRTNVIVTSHVRYVENPDGTKKGYPSSVGAALSPLIPRYFNSMALCQNLAGKRVIQTVSTGMIDLANPAPFKMAPQLPIEEGLATFFKTLRS